jgi:hypothetical protein
MPAIASLEDLKSAQERRGEYLRYAVGSGIKLDWMIFVCIYNPQSAFRNRHLACSRTIER